MKLSLVLLLLSVIGSAGVGLNDFRWKLRILVVTNGSASLRAELVKEGKGLLERDVRVFILDDSTKAANDALVQELRERLKIRDGVDEVLLLGKDGRTILRWRADKFTPSALFGVIDSMPMRKAEMLERRGG